MDTCVTSKLFRTATNFVALRSWCFRVYAHWTSHAFGLRTLVGTNKYFFFTNDVCSIKSSLKLVSKEPFPNIHQIIEDKILLFTDTKKKLIKICVSKKNY